MKAFFNGKSSKALRVTIYNSKAHLNFPFFGKNTKISALLSESRSLPAGSFSNQLATGGGRRMKLTLFWRGEFPFDLFSLSRRHGTGDKLSPLGEVINREVKNAGPRGNLKIFPSKLNFYKFSCPPLGVENLSKIY